MNAQCPKCGSGLRPHYGNSFACGSELYVDGLLKGTFREGMRCTSLQLARAKSRVASLEAENKSLRDRLSDADTERHAAQAALKAAFDRIAELEARCGRLEEIGDMIVDEYMVEKAEKDAWQQAKEAKP